MKVKKARKAYIKAKTFEEREIISGDFVSSLLDRVESANSMTPMQWRGVLKSIVIDAEYFASANVEYESGWKIHREWVKCIIAQIMGRDDKTEILFNSYGWDYEQSLNPMYDESTKYHICEFIEKETREERQIKILLESIGIMALGSKWQNKHGQEFTITSVENDAVYLEAQDVYGVWFDCCYTKEQVLQMIKVA